MIGVVVNDDVVVVDATESGDVDAVGKTEDSLLVLSIGFPVAAFCKHSLYHINSHIISDKYTSSTHININNTLLM